MGFLQKIGGRKFWMALITVAAAMFLEAKTDKGLTPTMAGFLGSIVLAFSATNLAATKAHAESKGGGVSNGDDKLDILLNAVQDAKNPELEQKVLEAFIGLQTTLQQVQGTTGQIGLGMLNLTKEVQGLKSKV